MKRINSTISILMVSAIMLLGCKSKYEKGYDAGFTEGHAEGYADTYDTGFNDGKTDGLATGYSNGFDQGLVTGYTDGWQLSRDTFATAEYENGYTEGDRTGYAAGFETGFAGGLVVGEVDGGIDGFNTGYSNGYNTGYNSGHADGYTIGYNDRYDNGYNDGADDGYADGFDDGYDDRYDDNWSRGDADGYADGYDDSYDDGYADGDSDGYWDGYDDGYDYGSSSKSNNPAVKLAAMVNADLIDYTKLKKFDAKNTIETGFEFSREGKMVDMEKIAALKEKHYLNEMTNQLVSKYSLSRSSASNIATISHQYNKTSGSRELTEADASQFSKNLIGFDIAQIETAFKKSLKGDSKDLKGLLEKASRNIGTSSEQFNNMVSEIFY